MNPLRAFLIASLLAVPLFVVPAAQADNVCTKLTEDEVSAAVGTPLKRSPTDPCRFGYGINSVYITMHAGAASQFDNYVAQARKEFPDVHSVSGLGSKAAFFGFNLAVQ